MPLRSTFVAFALATLLGPCAASAVSAQTVTLSGQGAFGGDRPGQFSVFNPGTYSFSLLLPTSPATEDLYVYNPDPRGGSDGFELRNDIAAVFSQGATEVRTRGYFTANRQDGATVFTYVEYSPVFFVIAAGSTQSFFTGANATPTFLPGTYTTSVDPIQSGIAEFRITPTSMVPEPSTTVPEPSTYAMMTAGLAALALARRRRERA